MSSATLTLNVCIVLSDPFSGGSSFYIVYVCNHCHWTNQNCCSMMGLTSHLSFVYNTFSSYTVFIPMMMILTIMVLGPGHLVRALFHIALAILLVVSVKYFLLVVSVEYFQLIESKNMLVVSV